MKEKKLKLIKDLLVTGYVIDEILTISNITFEEYRDHYHNELLSDDYTVKLIEPRKGPGYSMSQQVRRYLPDTVDYPCYDLNDIGIYKIYYKTDTKAGSIEWSRLFVFDGKSYKWILAKDFINEYKRIELEYISLKRDMVINKLIN